MRRPSIGASGLVLALSMLAVPQVAEGQCPAGSTCYFGTDVTGSSSTRATNVNSAAARANFLASLIGVGTETFEGLADGVSNPALVFPGAGTATIAGGGAVETQGAGTDNNGRYPSSGIRFYEATSASGGGSTFSINFASPVAAFGFYGIDIGEFSSQLALRFTLVGGSTLTWQLPYVATNGQNTPRDGSLLFAGFLDTRLFTSVAFLGTDSDDVFGFDDMTIGSLEQVRPPAVIPEPSTYVLLASGLAALGMVARRRRT